MPDQWDDVAAEVLFRIGSRYSWPLDLKRDIAAALRQAVAESVPRRFVNLIPDGESDFDQCEKCGGIFPDEMIQPTSAGPEHEHWCLFCIAAKEAVAEQREADAKIVEAWDSGPDGGRHPVFTELAAAIRKGGPA